MDLMLGGFKLLFTPPQHHLHPHTGPDAALRHFILTVSPLGAPTLINHLSRAVKPLSKCWFTHNNMSSFMLGRSPNLKPHRIVSVWEVQRDRRASERALWHTGYTWNRRARGFPSWLSSTAVWWLITRLLMHSLREKLRNPPENLCFVYKYFVTTCLPAAEVCTQRKKKEKH